MKLVKAARDSSVLTDWTTTADRGHLYWAFTDGLGDWLGEPSSTNLVVEPGAAFCIAVRPEWGGGVGYGRFVELRPNRRVVMTWISESIGGVETDVAIDLYPNTHGTDVTVAHARVDDPALRVRVAELWRAARHSLDALVRSSQPPI